MFCNHARYGCIIVRNVGLNVLGSGSDKERRRVLLRSSCFTQSRIQKDAHHAVAPEQAANGDISGCKRSMSDLKHCTIKHKGGLVV